MTPEEIRRDLNLPYLPGIPIRTDPRVPKGTAELRDRHGRVLCRIVDLDGDRRVIPTYYGGWGPRRSRHRGWWHRLLIRWAKRC